MCVLHTFISNSLSFTRKQISYNKTYPISSPIRHTFSELILLRNLH